jgi:serine protease Do
MAGGKARGRWATVAAAALIVGPLAGPLVAVASAQPCGSSIPQRRAVRGYTPAGSAIGPEPAAASTEEAQMQRLMTEQRSRLLGMSRARGWIGLRTAEMSEIAWTPDGRTVRYCGYPVIVSVEPSSPAERAGLTAGDTIVAYDGRDLVRQSPVPLDRMLVPGGALRVRVRRAGEVQERVVRVAPRPSQAVQFYVAAPDLPPELAAEAARARAVAGEMAARRAAARMATARASAPHSHEALVPFGRDELMPVPPTPPPPPASPVSIVTSWGAGGSAAALAGAQVMALDGDLRSALRTRAEAGVVVLKVLPGPAADAGLRAGDVIIAADGRAVETPRGLQQMLREGSAERQVRLRVDRGGKGRDVVLRW